MGNVRCTNCGSSYVKLWSSQTQYLHDGKVEHYTCDSCGREFEMAENNTQDNGEFLALFAGSDYNNKYCTLQDWTFRNFIELSRGDDGKINAYQFEDRFKKYSNLSNVSIKVQLTELSSGWVLDVSTGSYKDSKYATVTVHQIRLNDELTKRALASEAMRACHSIGNIFYLKDNKEILSDVANWLSSNLSFSRKNDYKQGCYVATAIYGAYDCPQVWTLRRYRDYSLAETWYGRAFVHTYYAISPSLVKWFGETQWFKNLWKPALDRMVEKLNAKGIAGTPYQDRNW